MSELYIIIITIIIIEFSIQDLYIKIYNTLQYETYFKYIQKH